MAKIKWELMGSPQMTVQVVPTPEQVPFHPSLRVWAPEGTEMAVDIRVRLYVPPGAQVEVADFNSLYSGVCKVAEESGRE